MTTLSHKKDLILFLTLVDYYIVYPKSPLPIKLCSLLTVTDRFALGKVYMSKGGVFFQFQSFQLLPQKWDSLGFRQEI